MYTNLCILMLFIVYYTRKQWKSSTLQQLHPPSSNFPVISYCDTTYTNEASTPSTQPPTTRLTRVALGRSSNSHISVSVWIHNLVFPSNGEKHWDRSHSSLRRTKFLSAAALTTTLDRCIKRTDCMAALVGSFVMKVE